jgi:hypothetical protein
LHIGDTVLNKTCGEDGYLGSAGFGTGCAT